MTTDYAAKTITITVRLDFYQASGQAPDSNLVGDIVKAIEAAWNGHKFKCFDVIIRVDAQAIVRRSAARPDAVDVRLDNSRIMARSHVHGAGGADHLSDDPAQRVEPGRDLNDPAGTTWGKYTDPQVWVHEFGHVVGLHDNYDPTDNSQTLPGARRDLMFSQGLPISAEMITRLIRRNNTNNQVDESLIKCPLSFDAGPASVNVILIEVRSLTIHAYTCDYDPPSGDPARRPRPIDWKGTAGASGSYNVPFFGVAGSYSGPIAFSSEADTPYSFALTSPTGSIEFGGTYTWGTKGVPVNVGPMTLFGVPSSAVGLGLYPVFSEGAAECP
jgi:hypothetical protein